MKSSITIHLAQTPAEREAIYRFRYDTYVREMKRTQQYADHDRGWIKEPLDDTAHLFALQQASQEIKIDERRARVVEIIEGFGSFLGTPYIFTSYEDGLNYLGSLHRRPHFLGVRLARGVNVMQARDQLRAACPKWMCGRAKNSPRAHKTTGSSKRARMVRFCSRRRWLWRSASQNAARQFRSGQP